MQLIVQESMMLLSYLEKYLTKYSKNNLKSFLKNKCIYVNDELVTKYNYELKENDRINIITNYINYAKDKKIDIIYEDKDLIIVNKPENLLTISTLKEKEKTLYHLVSNYVKKKNRNNKIFIVHRLDKDTSGLVILAKTKRVQEKLQADWDMVTRKYVALVHGHLKKNIILENYIKEGKNNLSFITSSDKGKKAISEVKVLKNINQKTLLEINIKTGRKNQIRLQLAFYGYPIIGDKKYGNKDTEKRMMLHAYYLKFIHPTTKETMEFKISIPF